MPGLPDCDICPYRDHASPCIALTSGLRMFCDVKREAIESSRRETPEPAPSAVREKHLLILGCDYRGPVTRQGCNCLQICFAGKGRGPGGSPGNEVSYQDCAACVASPA